MKVISSPQSGQIGNVVYVNSRYGQLVRQFVPPRNPRSEPQQKNRRDFGRVSSGWRGLSPDQRIAAVAQESRGRLGSVDLDRRCE